MFRKHRPTESSPGSTLDPQPRLPLVLIPPLLMHPFGSSHTTGVNAGDRREVGSIPGLGIFIWRRAWQPTPVCLSGESHGQRILGAPVHESQRAGRDWGDSAVAAHHSCVPRYGMTPRLSSCSARCPELHAPFTRLSMRTPGRYPLCFSSPRLSLEQEQPQYLLQSVVSLPITHVLLFSVHSASDFLFWVQGTGMFYGSPVLHPTLTLESLARGRHLITLLTSVCCARLGAPEAEPSPPPGQHPVHASHLTVGWMNLWETWLYKEAWVQEELWVEERLSESNFEREERSQIVGKHRNLRKGRGKRDTGEWLRAQLSGAAGVV